MKSITFLNSGGGGTLKFLYYAIQRLNLPLKITHVITDRPCGAYDFAQRMCIPATIVPYRKETPEALIATLKTCKTDIIITNITKILTSEVLHFTSAQFINLHYSLLPAFAGMCGMQTVDAARVQNCQFLGATCHEVSEVLDGGKILCQGCFPVDWREADCVIYNRMFRTACCAFLNALLKPFSVTPPPNTQPQRGLRGLIRHSVFQPNPLTPSFGR